MVCLRSSCKAQVSYLLLYLIIIVALVVILVLFVQVGNPIKDCVDDCNVKLAECFNKTGYGCWLVDGLAEVNFTWLG